MVKIFKRCKAPLIAVPLVFVFICLGGCKDKKKDIPAEQTRLQDSQYLKQLEDARKEQKVVARASNQVKDEMQKVIASARANLPKGATEEQVQAELNGHPEKYPTWKDLVAKNEAANAEIEKSLKDAQQVVRKRILKDLAGQKPVSAEKK